MSDPNVSIRKMDPDVWREIRAEAVRQHVTVAELIQHLWTAQVIHHVGWSSCEECGWERR